MENETIKKGIEAILNLLKEGDEKIKSPTSVSDNVILLIGNTGSGKSTIAQFVCNSNDNLISVETSSNSREFIISDNNSKISTDSTITSQTIFPELIVNTERGIVFYDCPGFSDTRSAGYDIAATYFTKKVVDMSKQVKLIFVVNYPSVRKGVDRLDFLLLVKHALRFTKNIHKFKNSIALVVTKVDNQYSKCDGILTLIPDETVISSIAEFLIELKRTINEKKHSQIDYTLSPVFYDNVIKFIDTLLEKDGDCYKRIGIFRRPDEPGPLLKIDFFKNEKAALERIVHENIIFSDKIDDDFGYSISDDSKNHIYDLVVTLNISVTAEIQQISDKVEVYFKNIEKNNFYNIYYLENAFNAANTIFREFVCNITNYDAAYIRDFIIKIEELNFNNFEIHLKNIDNSERYLKFLELVSGHKTLKKTEWIRGISHLIEYLRVSQKWYYFLIDLYSKLSEYVIQKDINALDVTNLIEQCSAVESTNLQNHGFIKTEVFKELLQFINNIIKDRISEALFSESEELFLNDQKLKSLQKVLNHTLNHKTSKERPSPEKLVIKGEYINLSEFLEDSFEEDIKYIEIYAKNKIFIDKDINKTGSRLQLCLISPVWEVIGDRKIILDGSAGSAQENPNTALGFYKNGRGKDGKPGKAGGPAGNFFGISGDMVGGFLYISANGGKGGPGQDGECGADGNPGKDGLFPSDVDNLEFDGNWKTYNGFEYRIKEVISFNLYLLSGYIYKYECKGKPSTDGCDGGNGGVGGIGGYGGKIRVEVLSNSRKISFSTSSGVDGPDGTGGEGGKGAQHGQSVIAMSNLKKFLFFSINDFNWSSFKIESSDKVSKSGQRGNDGFCGRGKEVPELGEDLVDCLPIINHYNNWASESLGCWVGDPSFPLFLKKLQHKYCLEESQNNCEEIQSEFDFLLE